MAARFLGIDLAGPGRASGYAMLDDEDRLIDVGLALDDAAIVELARRHAPVFVAIDAPLGLPAGLDCLDPAHDCAPSSPRGLRASELAVRALGYGLYFTTKKTIIRSLTERGIALRRELERRDLRVIEVYPFATKCVLFGKKHPRKTTPDGVRWLREQLAPLIGGIGSVARALSHDELDAIVAAHTAALFARGEAVALGDELEGTIVVPRVAATAAAP